MDVKSKIRKETDNFRNLPEGINNLHFYPDEIVVEQGEKDIKAVKEAFKTWFPNPDIYSPEEDKIYLDIARSTLDISIETGSDGHMEFIERPRFDNL
jgi:hypothetical protein